MLSTVVMSCCFAWCLFTKDYCAVVLINTQHTIMPTKVMLSSVELCVFTLSVVVLFLLKITQHIIMPNIVKLGVVMLTYVVLAFLVLCYTQYNNKNVPPRITLRLL